MIREAAILYLEGYLWDPEQPRAAMRDAIGTAREADRKVAFTLSDAFVIERHRADFLKLIEEGQIDILFANEVEICSLTMQNEFEDAIKAVAGKVPVLVVTRSEQGAICVVDGVRHQVAAEPIEKLVDTTGAGDLFAAGFLTGHVRGMDPTLCLKLGAMAAAECISHYGARPESDIKALMGGLLG
jgi:sugar/nucleoside kinase (ribokinase family)